MSYSAEEYFPVFGRVSVMHVNSHDPRLREILEECYSVVEYPEFNRMVCKWRGKTIAIAIDNDSFPFDNGQPILKLFLRQFHKALDK